jgi:group I intron endonuclease
MASFQGTIYLTTNQINGKIYIGQTYINKKGYIGSGKFLKKAIKKYGKNNFTRTILRNNVDSLQELNFWEDFYIKLFDSRNLEIGYNIVPGGSKGGFNHTPETIEKIRIRSNQQDNKLRIREIQQLAAKARIGKHHSTEVKLQIVKSKFGSLKEIEIYKKDGEIIHICNLSKEASDLTGVKPSAIRNNLAGLSKSAGGYIFKYKEIK